MEPPMEANTFSTSGDAKLAPKPFSPNSDSWCLPPLHLIPTEPKDFGYVDMSFVGDPLVEPKKRPKWHQYGGHYRPVRPGIPWMPSPEITSPLPLPAHIKLPSEIAVGTSDESLDTNSFSLCTAETKIPVDSDTKKQREASIQSINKECDDGDVSLSSRSSSSEEDSSSVVNSLFCGNSNEIVADEISVVDRSGSSSPVAFDRTLFGGRPLYLGQENISLAGLGSHIADSLAISKDQGSSWVGKLKTIRKKILARLQRVESSTSRPGYHAAPVMNWASNVADAEDRENTSSLSLGASVSPQRHLTTPLLDIIPPHSSASSSIERDGESRHGADDQSSERGGPRPLLILQEDGQIEGLAARAFDLISLPPDSWMEDAEGKRPSSIHGAYAVDHSRSDLPENTAESIEQDRDPGIQGHSSLGLVYQDVESASGEDTSDSWLGLELSLVGRAPPPRLAVIDLPVLDAAPLGLEGLEDQLSSAWPEASTSVSDPLYSEHEDMPSLGLSVILAPLGSFEPTPATTNDISHDTLDVPSSNSPVWYFRPPLRPNSIEASDSLDWLTSSTAEPPLEANPKSTFKPNTFSEEGPSSSSDSDVLGGMARSEEECVFASGFAVNPSDLLWPERDHCSAIPHALHDHDALPMENLAYCHYTSAYTSSSNCGRIEESQQQTLTLDLDAAPVPLPLQKEDGGERAFVERVRRKQAQARDNRRIKFTRQQVKENAPDQQSLSKRLGLPGTQDWRRYVVTTPNCVCTPSLSGVPLLRSGGASVGVLPRSPSRNNIPGKLVSSS
ncbi:hypothetical protein BKA70DRAFT_340116 [Coprinopsis sp. MPI-PUGE-AT-0042]|nr:hypothetical protein BKA70DRAFT_340116 [Coprinopsis sp. MPI-PUGE-AT-0042]